MLDPAPQADMAMKRKKALKNATYRFNRQLLRRKGIGKMLKSNVTTVMSSNSERGKSPDVFALTELAVKVTLAAGAALVNDTELALGRHWIPEGAPVQLTVKTPANPSSAIKARL